MAKVKKSVATPESDHLGMIRDPDRWPCWPYLPVKNRKMGSDIDTKGLGVLVSDGVSLTIYHVYLFKMPRTSEEFKASPKTEYTCHEEMLADGWEVD